ncbi:MAG: hypothetical protein ACLFOC_05770 [Campylobacterales bacterium]
MEALYSSWIENDINPVVFFSGEGRIVHLNKEAQYLLSVLKNSELFEIVQSYAPHSFGYNTHYVELKYDRFEFFAITVGYESEEIIGIRLYKKPKKILKQPIDNKAPLVNVYMLLDLCISTKKINNEVEFINEFDPAIPEIRVDEKKLLKLFDKLYAPIHHSTKVITRLYIKVGEHIKTPEGKLRIIRVEVESEDDMQKYRAEIERTLYNLNISASYDKTKISLDIPAII